MCRIVFSWNDDRITADFLLYFLFVRTYDIFVSDEIYNKLETLNDDTFYSFMYNLSFGEFIYGNGYNETYDLDDEEKDRVSEIIKARKHPREKKLLEQLYRWFMNEPTPRTFLSKSGVCHVSEVLFCMGFLNFPFHGLLRKTTKRKDKTLRGTLIWTLTFGKMSLEN